MQGLPSTSKVMMAVLIIFICLMTFRELQVGDYFRIPGISAECAYRKASDSHCSQNALLQPIRSETTVVLLTPAEVRRYFAAKHEFVLSLMK